MTEILDNNLIVAESDNTANTQYYTSFFNGSVPDIDSLYNQYYPDYTNNADIELTSQLDNIIATQNKVTNAVINANNYAYAKDYANYRKTKDISDIDELTNKTKGDLYKSNKSYWDYKNGISALYFNLTILRLSIITAICIALVLIATRSPSPKIKEKVAIIISCSIFGVYILVIIAMYSNWARKRNDDWSKYNFKAPLNVK